LNESESSIVDGSVVPKDKLMKIMAQEILKQVSKKESIEDKVESLAQDKTEKETERGVS